MVAVLVGITCLGAGIAITAFVYEKELHRMVRFLLTRDRRSNTRMTKESASPGLAQMARAVNEQLDAIQEGRLAHLRHRQDFQRDLSSLSHDIRTPLMGAKGYLQLAEDETDEAERSRFLTAAISRLDDMSGLLDQLFAHSRATDPDVVFDMRPTPVFPLLARVLVGHYPAFARRGWEPQVIFADEDVTIEADGEALARMFDNLIDNMIRHGVAAPVIEQRGCIVTFANEVADPEGVDIDRLFDRFYRADTSRGSQGTGLGLAVVKSLATAMGMKVEAVLVGCDLRISIVGAAEDQPLSEAGSV